MLRPTLATMLAIILIVSVVLTVVPSPRVSAAVPGGNGRIAFTSNRDGNPEIHVMNPDGSGQTRLTHSEGNDFEAAWSPDGGKIAFTSSRDGNTEIYVMNADGSGQTKLTNSGSADGRPAWSPDGTKIAFWSDRDGDAEIYVMNADGSGQTNITNNDVYDGYPAWSPDGTKIAFTSARDGNAEVYVMNADGSGQTNVTSNNATDCYPAWSPDGGKIAFTSDRDGNFEVYVMNADGSGQTRLTSNEAADEWPAWSPHGTKVAFSSNRDGNYEVYMMNADGSDQTNLTNNAAVDFDPAWWQQVGGLANLLLFHVLPEGSIVMVIGDFALNPHGSKPSGVQYQQGRDTTPLGYLRGMVDNTQPCVFDTDAAINATTGRPLSSVNQTLIFSIGGPSIDAVAYYYENTNVTADMAPVKLGYNGTHYWWTNTTDGTRVYTGLQSETAVPPGTSDVFVIQILRDADNRLVVLMYGTRYTGTWAAAEYFKFIIYPNITDYTASYYIVQWTDAVSGTSANFMPDSGDTFTIMAQG